MQCVLCNVYYVVCIVHCAMCSVMYAECSMQCVVCSVQCAVCSVHSVLDYMQCEVCRVYSVQCRCEGSSVETLGCVVRGERGDPANAQVDQYTVHCTL